MKKPLTVGNLLIADGDGVVTLTLNTYHRGQPYALFTKGELPTLIAELQKLVKSASAPNEFEDLLG
jgi:hypothetical protein